MINAAELLFTVDEHNQPIEPRPRGVVHANHTWHRTSHIWIINGSQQILCQQRSLLKDASPGKWEPFFGGHIGPGVSYEIAAMTEVEEELGLSLHPSDLIHFDTFKFDDQKEFQGIFVVRKEIDIPALQLEAEEVEQVLFIPIDEVVDKTIRHPSPEWSIAGYSAQILDFLTP